MATRGPNPNDKTDQVVRALKNYERPFMGTGELADEMGYTSNPGVAKHLERAEEKGEVKKTTISGYNVWYLPDLVQESEIQHSGPAPGSGGGRPPQEDKEDDEFQMSGKGKDLPGVFILLILGGTLAFIGWELAKKLYANVEGDKLRESLYGALTAGFTSVVVGTPALVTYYYVVQADSTAAGLFGVAMGTAGYLGVVVANGGFVGISAQAADRILSKTVKA